MGVYRANHGTSVSAIDSRVLTSELPHFSKPYLTCAEEVSGFYDLHPHANKALVTTVLWCLRDGENTARCERNIANVAAKLSR